MSTKPAGYFVWTRRNGKLGYHKYAVEGDLSSPDTKAYYESFQVPGSKTPLSSDEFNNLSLDQLAAKYPPPQEKADQDAKRGNPPQSPA